MVATSPSQHHRDSKGQDHEGQDGPALLRARGDPEEGGEVEHACGHGEYGPSPLSPTTHSRSRTGTRGRYSDVGGGWLAEPDQRALVRAAVTATV
jgi:hypothetical protein